MTDRHISVGDNLEFLGSIGDGAAQLVYMDPPFASGREYKAVLQARRDMGTEMVEAFSDTWNQRVEGKILASSAAALLIEALRPVVARPLLSYLRMMTSRIHEAWRVLDDRGSIYLHCDPSASHYLKMILDVTFGPENFRNEIIWRRTHAHSSSKRFGPVHDVLFFYSKSSRYVWNQPHIPYSNEYLEKYYSRLDDKGAYQLITCTGPGDRTGTRAHYEWRGQLPPAGRHWAWKVEQMERLEASGQLVYSRNGIPRLKRYVDEAPGVAMQDVWSDIGRLDAHSAERIGYDTQKPIALLTRIIEASSEPGALVIDPFAGSGTTAVAAERAHRRWAVADLSLLAGSLSLSRVRQVAGDAPIQLSGFPGSTRTAEALRSNDPTTFGAWGTSMMAATIDRLRSSGGVTKGKGLLVAESNRTETRSWVPLRGTTPDDIATPKDVPAGVQRGFVLGSPQSVRWVNRQFKGARPAFTAFNVSLADAISGESRSRGMASALNGQN